MRFRKNLIIINTQSKYFSHDIMMFYAIYELANILIEMICSVWLKKILKTLFQIKNKKTFYYPLE